MHRFLLAAVIMAAAILGCSGDQDYSGDFSVTNLTDRTITVADWKNFGRAQPPRGFVVPTKLQGIPSKTSEFPRLKELPKDTTVVWSSEGNEVRLSQKIDLTKVVPKGVKGTTNFTLSADGKWTVEFIPAPANP